MSDTISLSLISYHQGLTAILEKYGAQPVLSEQEKMLTGRVKWKSNNGHKCSVSITIIEKEDASFEARRSGLGVSSSAVEPEKAITWLRTQLSVHAHEILA